METLRQKQSRFVLMVARLIEHADSLGYSMTFGHAWRSPACTVGSEVSLHRDRLAVDLNLFKDGVWLKDGSGHDELHVFWSSIGGAERIQNDLNHYSLEHERRR